LAARPEEDATVTTAAEITIPTDDGPMPTFEAAPAGEPRGAVVVIQEAFGVTGHIRNIATRLSEAGWLAVAPALFHRQGSPVLGYDELDKVMPVMGELSAGGIATDLAATFDRLESTGFAPHRTGIVGFCMGGTVSFYAGTLRPIGAAVTFYGGGVGQGRFGLPPLVELAPSLRVPWLGLYGDKDKGIPVEDVEALREAAARAPVETEVVRYPDAEHGFNCNDRPAFNPTAAKHAWHRTLDWFDRHLTP